MTDFDFGYRTAQSADTFDEFVVFRGELLPTIAKGQAGLSARGTGLEYRAGWREFPFSHLLIERYNQRHGPLSCMPC